jgi:hypothetical protein
VSLEIPWYGQQFQRPGIGRGPGFDDLAKSEHLVVAGLRNARHTVGWVALYNGAEKF